MSEQAVALITGSARRIGAEIARTLHQAGYRILIHYRQSEREAGELAAELNALCAGSAHTLQADLVQVDQVQQLATDALAQWGRVDVLINNASSYYPTPFGKVTENQWDDLNASNSKSPFFLSQALAESLKKHKGCIVNIVDIHAERPLPDFTPYSIAKAANAMLTKSLARELAPAVRVNGVAPGVIVWPEDEGEISEPDKVAIMSQVPLARVGEAGDIAKTVLFFVKDAPYITGQILAVDGGRSIYL